MSSDPLKNNLPPETALPFEQTGVKPLPETGPADGLTSAFAVASRG